MLNVDSCTSMNCMTAISAFQVWQFTNSSDIFSKKVGKQKNQNKLEKL